MRAFRLSPQTVDQDGGATAVAAAAVMRSKGKFAEILEGGYAAWERAGLPSVKLGRTWWVASPRPKVDRIEAGRTTRRNGWL